MTTIDVTVRIETSLDAIRGLLEAAKDNRFGDIKRERLTARQRELVSGLLLEIQSMLEGEG